MFIHRSTWQWIFPAQSSNKDFVFDGEFFWERTAVFLLVVTHHGHDMTRSSIGRCAGRSPRHTHATRSREQQ